MQTATPFPRHIAVVILATLACSFAANHIAARIAFDHDTGLLLAMLCRAGVTLLALAALVLWRRESLRLSAPSSLFRGPTMLTHVRAPAYFLPSRPRPTPLSFAFCGLRSGIANTVSMPSMTSPNIV